MKTCSPYCCGSGQNSNPVLESVSGSGRSCLQFRSLAPRLDRDRGPAWPSRRTGDRPPVRAAPRSCGPRCPPGARGTPGRAPPSRLARRVKQGGTGRRVGGVRGSGRGGGWPRPRSRFGSGPPRWPRGVGVATHRAIRGPVGGPRGCRARGGGARFGVGERGFGACVCDGRCCGVGLGGGAGSHACLSSTVVPWRAHASSGPLAALHGPVQGQRATQWSGVLI